MRPLAPALAALLLAAGPATGQLRVTVPRADAELKIQGEPTAPAGTVRAFAIPPVVPGAGYTYRFEATWRPNNYTVMTRTRTVEFVGGSEVVVDLTKPEGTDKAVIRYVPTPPDVVARMVKLAGVKAGDVVFEPGCGDGRITVAAVKAGAARGVGIDLDPERVAEARSAAKAAGVADRVDIRQGDALDVNDLGDATVVFLYMGDEFDALIRPILWKQLKPGSRLVSHRFTMGDWEPDRTEKFTGADGHEYRLHLWNVTEAVKKRAGEGK